METFRLAYDAPVAGLARKWLIVRWKCQMTIDERLERLTHTVEFVATLQRTNEEHIGKLIEQGDLSTRRVDKLATRMDELTERTIQTMDAINRLARIVESHEQRIEDIENQFPS